MVDALGAHLERNPEIPCEDGSLIPNHPRIDEYAEQREVALALHRERLMETERYKLGLLIEEALEAPGNKFTREELELTAAKLFYTGQRLPVLECVEGGLK